MTLPAGGEPAWHALRIARIVEETADARSFVLDVPEALRDRFGYRAGQFLTFQVPWQGTLLGRCYSLSSAPECDDALAVTVKRVAGGRVSNWFHDALGEGDVVLALAPAGRFVLREASERPLVCFAGGSGITPIYSLLKSALATSRRLAKLLYANRDRDSILFRSALDGLAREHAGRLRIVHHVDAEHGFVDQERVRELAAGLEDAEFYLCGPAPFMEIVERALTGVGVPRERLAIERFASPADGALPNELDTVRDEPPAFADGACALVLHLDGATHEVVSAPGETVLAAARRIGLSPPAACEDGYCGACAGRLLRGLAAMAQCHALDPGEVADGWILTCQARPTTPECEVEWES